MNLGGETGNYCRVLRVRVKIARFEWILIQVLQFVQIFIAQTKFPAVGRNQRPGGFSTARLIMRRRASLLPFFTFVRFGAHSRKTLFGEAVALLINGKDFCRRMGII